MKLLCTLALLLATNAAAETVVATRTIRPQQIVTAQDLRLDPAVVQGAHNLMAEVIGQEAKYIIYPGRAVMHGSVGAPAVVQRNQVVEMVFSSAGLRIVAEGRALARGGVGDRIRVMNTDSRTVLFGTISPTGTVLVSQ